MLTRGEARFVFAITALVFVAKVLFISSSASIASTLRELFEWDLEHTRSSSIGSCWLASSCRRLEGSPSYSEFENLEGNHRY